MHKLPGLNINIFQLVKETLVDQETDVSVLVKAQEVRL